MSAKPVLLAFSLALLATIAADAGSATDRAADTRAIIAGERDLGRAFVSGDVATIRHLLADDFQGVAPRGAFYDKVSVLKELRAGPHITSDEVGPITLRFYGDTAIAQAHEYEVGPPPARKAGEHVFTDTWVKLHGRWRIVAAEDLDLKNPQP
ncbi:MAG TPA: nuclear transport factor 2 family protein [Caulobacteraceae bacterium]|jgi:hypothetical protein|nr:nuclear transport factor 2 family protein [Caulobacteraceae bacterium]